MHVGEYVDQDDSPKHHEARSTHGARQNFNEPMTGAVQSVEALDVRRIGGSVQVLGCFGLFEPSVWRDTLL